MLLNSKFVINVAKIAISLFSIAFFENFSLMFVGNPLGFSFFVNQFIAIIFITATYLSARMLGEALP